MEDERKETKILVLCVLGAICVIVISIIALIGIWTPEYKEEVEQEKQTVSDSIGSYENIQYSVDEQVAKYSEDIINYISTKNIDKIYEITSPEYLEYFNMDKESLRKDLENKGFYGLVLTSNKYNTSTIHNNKYFRLSLNTKNNNYVDGTINIIEYSPNDYKIAFDKFVFYKKEPIKYVREDLQITVSEQVAFDTLYNVTISITNNSNDTVYLNNNEEYEFICLVNNSGNEIGTATHLYAGQVVELPRNKTINMELSFSIDDMSIDTIKAIKIKDVVMSKTGIVNDINLDI